MEYLRIQGEEIPVLGLGTSQLIEKNVNTVKTALKNGYSLIDTAQAYGNEAEIGRGIRESGINRDDIWLTTKVWRDSLTRRQLKNSVDGSLKKLKTNYVDLLLIHWPFPEMELDTVLGAMNDLVKEGKVRNIGVSNFTTKQMEKAQEISRKKILTNQVEYHPFLSQDEVLEKCRQQEMMLTAYSPLARGDVIGSRTLQDIGDKYGKSEAQIALRWLTQQPNVATIPKASSEEHLKENMEIFDFQLSDEEMKEIWERTEKSVRKFDPVFAPEWD